jgi:hypothetical protein
MAKIRDTFTKVPSGWKVTDPITGVRFEANSYRNLKGKIDTHRRSNNLPVDGLDEWIAEQICAKNAPEYCQEWPNLTNAVLKMLGFDGPGLWGELHRRTLSHDDSPDWVWLDMWAEKIPKYGCSCRSKWKEWKHENPPPWDKEGYWRWGWAFHNHVNQELGKPPFSIDQARQIWTR